MPQSICNESFNFMTSITNVLKYTCIPVSRKAEGRFFQVFFQEFSGQG